MGFNSGFKGLREREGTGNEEEALGHTLYRTRFGRGCGPDVRQTTEGMDSIVLVGLC